MEPNNTSIDRAFLDSGVMPSATLDEISLLSGRLGRGRNELIRIYQEVTEKINAAHSSLDQLDNYQALYKEVLEARSQELTGLEPDELEVLVTEVEQARENVPGMAGGEPLSREVGELANQLNDLFNKSQDGIDNFTDLLIEQRKQVTAAINDAPNGMNIPEIRRRQIVEQAKITDFTPTPPDLRGELASGNPNPIESIRELRREEEESFRGEKNEEFDSALEEQDRDVATAQTANSLRLGMDEDTFRADLDALQNTGRVTERQAERYRSGEVNRQDFVDQIGPTLAAGYVSERATPPPPLPPGPGDPPPGPDEDDTDPLNVRVVNEPSDPVPVTGAPGGGGPLGGAGSGSGDRTGGSGGRRDPDTDQAAEWMRQQEIANIIGGITSSTAGIITPGGGGMMGDVAFGAAARAATSPLATRALMGLGGTIAGGLGLPAAGAAATALGGVAAAVPAAGVAGGKAWYEAAQFQQNTEAQFGENQGRGLGDVLDSELISANVSARLENLMLPGEAITEFTSAMADLGATAEETAEALGPAAEALDKYRMLTPEMAARSARRGQQFSPIGGAETEVLGASLEDLAGGGFSTETITSTATSAAEVFDAMGAPGGDLSGNAMTSYLQGSQNPQLDMLLEGTAQQGVQGAERFGQDPISQGALLTAITGNSTYETLNTNTPEGQRQLLLAPQETISQFDPSGLTKDDTGKIDIGAKENLDAAQMSVQMSTLTSAGYTYTPAQFLGEVARIQEAGGFEGVVKETEAKAAKDEKVRTEINEDATGVTQEKKREEQGGAGSGLGNTVPGGLAGGFRHFAANLTGIDALRPQDTQDKGLAGNLGGDWRGEKGGTIGALSTISGMDFDRVDVTGGGSLEEALADPERRKAIESGEEKLQVGDEKLTAEEVTKGARAGEIEFDTGFLTLGSKLQRTGEKKSGGEVQVKFTGKAAEFFEVDTSNPNTNAGQTNNAQAADRTNREGAATNSNGKRGPQQTKP